MNNTKAILKTLRLPNLVMLAVVQFIVSHFIVEYYSVPFYLLITSSTILIALGGYLLNDIQDIEIDKLNNKLGWIRKNNKKEATIIAIVAHLIGLILGFFACRFSDPSFFPWFIGASLALVAYAYFFSKYKIIGNFLISGLIALAILLAYYLGKGTLTWELKNFKSGNEIFVWVYAALGFLLNWTREVCKDIEDLDGDKLHKRYSLPIVLGIPVSKFFIGFILVGFISLAMAFLAMHLVLFSITLLFLIIYLFLLSQSLYSLYQADSANDYHQLSLKLKILMLLGVFVPVILYLSI